MTTTADVIDTIKEVLEDPSIQKNIRQKLDKIVVELQSSDKKSIKLKVDKCVNELDEISNDSNVQSFVRTQIWGIVSMLESLE